MLKIQSWDRKCKTKTNDEKFKFKRTNYEPGFCCYRNSQKFNWLYINKYKIRWKSEKNAWIDSVVWMAMSTWQTQPNFHFRSSYDLKFQKFKDLDELWACDSGCIINLMSSELHSQVRDEYRQRNYIFLDYLAVFYVWNCCIWRVPDLELIFKF